MHQKTQLSLVKCYGRPNQLTFWKVHGRVGLMCSLRRGVCRPLSSALLFASILSNIVFTLASLWCQMATTVSFFISACLEEEGGEMVSNSCRPQSFVLFG